MNTIHKCMLKKFSIFWPDDVFHNQIKRTIQTCPGAVRAAVAQCLPLLHPIGSESTIGVSFGEGDFHPLPPRESVGPWVFARCFAGRDLSSPMLACPTQLGGWVSGSESHCQSQLPARPTPPLSCPDLPPLCPDNPYGGQQCWSSDWCCPRVGIFWVL